MAPLVLDRRTARRVALAAQGLTSARPGDLLEVVERVGVLKLEPTAYVAPNADLVPWSRLGASYDVRELDARLADGSLVEHRGEVRPARDLPLLRAVMAVWPGVPPLRPWQEDLADWVAANDVARREVLARLEREGPLRTSELPDLTEVPWLSTGWTHEKNLARLLDLMTSRGEVALAGREGGQRLWDLAERVHPLGSLDVPPYDDALRLLQERRLRSLGIARGNTTPSADPLHEVGTAGVEAVVEGVRGRWRVDPLLLDEHGVTRGRWPGRTALLSPLDQLVFDRKRLLELFGWDYQLEMYKPVAKRRWGYFALPVLHSDGFVGKADVQAIQAQGVLRVHALHWDRTPTTALERAVRMKVAELASWLELGARFGGS
ncbi:DNA glycosylase AlkZ-like family protein [Lapillicoccus jejuensis]|uniref:Winged helix-turn-helix domain-containing protein n=1 Tax=Lapillicoccus jejuensis TaxID=402171 RepID=A0A542DZD3_9MICO|nr:crosslink repair DNA glycosylase YcaQ family protein [Lapillicoccus jejuensis]TQJ08447.1 hypothetical protein FB458_1536 [Lapillicoccus jejuensis]